MTRTGAVLAATHGVSRRSTQAGFAGPVESVPCRGQRLPFIIATMLCNSPGLHFLRRQPGQVWNEPRQRDLLTLSPRLLSCRPPWRPWRPGYVACRPANFECDSRTCYCHAAIWEIFRSLPSMATWLCGLPDRQILNATAEAESRFGRNLVGISL